MKDATDITIVLDRSGSMQAIAADTIGGVNRFVEDQKKVEGECVLTLVQFDSQDPQFVTHDAVPIDRVKDVFFQPRAMTPLYDAVGRAIVRAGERLAKLPEAERPKNVIFVIVTDGYENASKEYTREQVFKMIKEQTDTYKWQFVYLGANQDAMAVGRSIGIDVWNSLDYAAKGPQVGAAYTNLSANVADMRKGARASLGWSPKQREESK